MTSLPIGDRVRFLLNTHWHDDHTGGDTTLGAGAVLVAHEHVRDLLTSDQTIPGRVSKALPSAALPSITYADALTVYAGGEAIRLVRDPRAHTDGDTVVSADPGGRPAAPAGSVDEWVPDTRALDRTRLSEPRPASQVRRSRR